MEVEKVEGRERVKNCDKLVDIMHTDLPAGLWHSSSGMGRFCIRQ